MRARPARALELEVPDEAAGTRLDRFLADRSGHAPERRA